MKQKLLSAILLLAACNRPTEPTPVAAPTTPPSAPASASASASASPSASASAPAPRASLHARSYDHLCPEIAGTTTNGDAGTSRPPTATDLMISAKTKTVKKEFVASIAIPAKRIEREVFRMGTEGDPFQCCSRATADGLDVACMFSGVDTIDGRARASVEDNEVVIRWCKANLSVGNVLDRGEDRIPRGGANAWFGASTPACAPKLPQ